MYCGACGKPVHDGDHFCGECGAKIETTPSSSVSSGIKANTSGLIDSFKNMSSTTKKNLSIAGGVLGVLVIAYFTARFMHGPSSPEEFKKQFDAAIDAKNMSQLAKLIDPEEKELLSSTSLNLFKESLNDKVAEHYKGVMGIAVDSANETNTPKNLEQFFSDGPKTSWIKLTKQQSWLGTTWRVHIPVCSVTLDKQQNDLNTYKISIGNLSNSTQLTGLYPSNYTININATNDFASEQESESVDFSSSINPLKSAYNFTLNPTNLLKHSADIEFPANGFHLQATLNGKPLKEPSGNDHIIHLAPAPVNMKIVATADLLGFPIQGEKSFDLTKDQGHINLQDITNDSIAKKALDILYDAALTWTRAVNDKNPSEIKDADPNGSYFKKVSESIKNATNKYQLKKVYVDPESIRIDGDTLYINDAEVYNDSTARWQYALKQNADKTSWWIEQDGSIGFFGRYPDQIDQSISKESTADTTTATTDQKYELDAMPTNHGVIVLRTQDKSTISLVKLHIGDHLMIRVFAQDNTEQGPLEMVFPDQQLADKLLDKKVEGKAVILTMKETGDIDVTFPTWTQDKKPETKLHISIVPKDVAIDNWAISNQ